jgi:hypothetical protein
MDVLNLFDRNLKLLVFGGDFLLPTVGIEVFVFSQMPRGNRSRNHLLFPKFHRLQMERKNADPGAVVRHLLTRFTCATVALCITQNTGGKGKSNHQPLFSWAGRNEIGVVQLFSVEGCGQLVQKRLVII